MVKKKILLSALFFFSINIYAQIDTLFQVRRDLSRINSSEFRLPLDIKPTLSASFGELRENHFHSGLDFKTNQHTGQPIHAVADGWVSRIKVSPYGYGNAIYLNHYNDFTTVYGHMLKYSKVLKLDSLVQSLQYRYNGFGIDKYFKKDEIKIKKGDIIGYSGNSGNSGGPHLHFEIRDLKSQEPIDPLYWFKDKFHDTRSPQIHYIKLYSFPGLGAIEDTILRKNRYSVRLVENSKNEYCLTDSLPSVWGRVALGINAYEKMSGTSNIYGIYLIKAYVNNHLYFSQEVSRFSFYKTRYVNSVIDYGEWKQNHSVPIRCYKKPGNILNIYPYIKNKGFLDIKQQKKYDIKFVLEDIFGNTSTLKFSLKGKKQNIPPFTKSENYMRYNTPNSFSNEEVDLKIPVGCLYDNVNFEYKNSPSPYYSNYQDLYKDCVALQSKCRFIVKLKNDTLKNKKAYYLAQIDKDGDINYVGGDYNDGYLKASISDFGRFVVMADTLAPKIRLKNIEESLKKDVICIDVRDNVEDIEQWNATIDGINSIFSYDPKFYSMKFDLKNYIHPVKKTGGLHTLIFNAYDVRGNRSTLTYKFKY